MTCERGKLVHLRLRGRTLGDMSLVSGGRDWGFMGLGI